MLVNQINSINYNFSVSPKKYTSKGVSNNVVRKIKVTPDKAVELTIKTALATFFASFFGGIKEIKDDKRVEDIGKLVESINEDKFNKYQDEFLKEGYIIDSREDLAILLKDQQERSGEDYWYEKGMNYWQKLSFKIVDGNLDKEDEDFIRGMENAIQNDMIDNPERFDIVV